MTEEKKKESELSQVMNAINDSTIMAMTDAKGVITSVNENFEKISGYSKEELIGHNHSILKSGSHSTEFFKQMWSTIKSGEIWHGEIENVSKSGEHYFVRTMISPLKDVEGNIERFLAIRFDITPRKVSENARARSAIIQNW